MNKLIIILFITVLMLGAWWLWTTKSDTEPTVQPTEEVTSTGTLEAIHENNLITRQPSSSDRQVYINQDWRFSFEYPVGWKVREPAFGSKASLFNMAIWPETHGVFDPVTINITPRWWIDRLIDDPANDFREINIIDNRTSLTYSSVTMSVIPVVWYFTLIHEEYWVGISIQDEYSDELQIILDSFKFHEPMPHLKDLDVEPYMPDYIKTQSTYNN